MGDRYRYARPRSPTLHNPARASLPINTSGYSPHSDQHLHVVPSSRRDILPGPRSSTSSVATSGPITTTTYKITPDPPGRGSSVREGNRTRRSTLENSTRPATIVTAAPRHRPVVHSGDIRPNSPSKNPYRGSEEEFYSMPATSKHGHHHHHKRYSATMDNADMNRFARERDSSRLRIGDPREQKVAYSGTRSRDSRIVSSRHTATVADDHGDDGYGYMNPRDLVQYDLNNSAPVARHHSRRDSFEGGRARPSSITSYNDVIPRSYDSRERGPPPSIRGFDKVYRQPPAALFDWENSSVRMPVAPIEPVQRPAPVQTHFDSANRILDRRNSTSRRPVSLYHDREKRQPQREEYYEARDNEPRHRDRERSHRHERYNDDNVEERGFGIRPERTERSDRVERSDRPEKRDKDEDKNDHKGRDVVATGLSLAGAALGVKAFKDAGSDDRDDRDEPRRRRDRDYDREYDREYNDESRRRRDPRDDREAVDLSGRDPKERRRSRDKEINPLDPSDESLDLSGRDPKERQRSRDRDLKPRGPSDKSLDLTERDSKERRSEHREEDERSRRHRPEVSSGTEIDNHSESSLSDEAGVTRSRRERRQSTGPAQAFDPKNTKDLKALKDALNAQTVTAAVPVAAADASRTPTRTPRESLDKDTREVADIRSSLKEIQDPRAVRIVTPPPPTSATTAPVKGILRQPREKFPEDPTPIREGVAPLKDAKRDGVPPDARWTKISRKLVNPGALEAGKERYEAREDFVIVLRVLSRDEVQTYAEVTEKIRAAREEAEKEEERLARRSARRERHERHRRERSERGEREPSRDERRSRRRKEKVEDSESDSTEDEYDKPKMIEGGPVMSGGQGISDGKPAPPVASNAGSRRDRDRDRD